MVSAVTRVMTPGRSEPSTLYAFRSETIERLKHTPFLLALAYLVGSFSCRQVSR